MGVDFDGAVSRAWGFAKSAERFSIMALYIAAAVLMVLLPVAVFYKSLAGILEAANALATIQFFAWFFVAIILAVLLMLYASLMFTHNYANQKSLTKSAAAAKGKYLRFVLASLIVAIISMAGSMLDILLPLLGTIASLIIGMIFFFVEQEIILGGSRIMRALNGSYTMFKNNWIEVLLAGLVSCIISFLVALIFAVPLIYVLLSVFLSGAQLSAPALIGSGLVAVIGFAFAALLGIGIKTDVYMQLKKRKKA